MAGALPVAFCSNVPELAGALHFTAAMSAGKSTGKLATTPGAANLKLFPSKAIPAAIVGVTVHASATRVLKCSSASPDLTPKNRLGSATMYQYLYMIKK